MGPGRWTDRGSARGISGAGAFAADRCRASGELGYRCPDRPLNRPDGVDGSAGFALDAAHGFGVGCRVETQHALAVGREERCGHNSRYASRHQALASPSALVLVPYRRRERALDDDVRRAGGTAHRAPVPGQSRDRSVSGSRSARRADSMSGAENVQTIVRPSAARKLPCQRTRCRSKHQRGLAPPSRTSAGVNGSSKVRSRNRFVSCAPPAILVWPGAMPDRAPSARRELFEATRAATCIAIACQVAR